MIKKINLKIRQIINTFNADSVSFKINHELDDEGIDWPHTDIIVNGESIFEKLKKYEVFEAQRTKTDEKLAGKYVGIDPSDLIKYFTDDSGMMILNKNKFRISISQCSKCRSRCTSHLYCSCTIKPFSIEFSDFRQEFKPMSFDNVKRQCPENIEKHKWNYEPFGPFKFPKGEFYLALKKLIK